MAKNNQRDPNLRAATVARVNQLVKGGMTKAAAFVKISAETGRAKDAVQMLYYRAVRAARKGAKPVAQKAPVAAAARPRSRRRPSRSSRATATSPGELPAVLSGIAAAINALLKHVEKTVEENKTLREQAKRLQAITSLIRGR